MKKDINSNGYIFLYATILIVVVAVLLAATALWLQPFQDRNKKNEKRINILTAAGIPEVSAKNAAWLFEKHCTASFLLDENGNPTEEEGLPVFVIDRQTSVIPMQGNGLWGPIWGYLAIASDGKTVVGTTFGHKSETPGLGGEITTEKFQGQFAGKQIMNNGSVVPIEFDAITGATKTSNGVKEMIDNTLEKYSAYLKKFAERGE
ncbi:MAG: FMN-binding protein [Bacteroidales bacterium]|jgi:Na+-transporting NADH:ubiquinone oxidoreductase, subunit NqrC|nr:FMN-binding protein [Bacteroidales bacterium]MBR3428182.1 FMN-binding protein [Bacteroidales bacterium]